MLQRYKLEHVTKAYTTIAHNKSGEAVGLSGTDFMQLLGMACSDFSPQASDTIMRAFYKHPHEAVSFAGFYCAMNTCLLYEVFIRKTEELFASLDVHGSGYATKAVCEHVLNALAVCVGDYRHTPQSRAVDDARLVELLKSDTDGPQIKLSIFLRSASNLYLKLILIMKKDGALWPKTD